MNREIADKLEFFSSIPHRGAGTTNEKKIIRYLKSFYSDKNIQVNQISFPLLKDSLFSYPLIFLSLLLLGILVYYKNHELSLLATLIGLMFLFKFPSNFPLLLAKLSRKKSTAVISHIPAKSSTNKNLVITAHFDTSRETIYVKHLSKFIGKIILGNKLSNHIPIIKFKSIPLLNGPFFIVNLISLIQVLLIIFSIKIHFILILFTITYSLGIAYCIHALPSEYVQGAVDNGLAVIASMTLAENALKMPLSNFNLVIINNSAEETMTKPLAYIADTLNIDKENSYFLNLECLGSEYLTYCIGEINEIGNAKHYNYFKEDIFNNFLDTKPNDVYLPKILAPFPTDAHKLLEKDYKVIGTFCGLELNAVCNIYHQKNDTFKNANLEKFYADLHLIKSYINFLDKNCGEFIGK